MMVAEVLTIESSRYKAIPYVVGKLSVTGRAIRSREFSHTFTRRDEVSDLSFSWGDSDSGPFRAMAMTLSYHTSGSCALMAHVSKVSTTDSLS